jgi:hypothetical protein
LTDAYDRRLSRMGLPTQATSMLDGPPMEAALANLPELNVESDVTASTTASTTIRVSVAAKAASGAQLASLRVFVNDVPALAAIDRASSPASPSVDGFRLSAPRFSARLGIRLSTVFGGRNQITLSAVDSLGRESLIERLEVTTTSKPAHDPVRYVVAIGVSQYRDGRYNLDYASADARSIGALFDHPQSTTWSGHTKTLILQDEEVTRDLIRKVRDFLAPAAIDDMVILFVASHGTIDSNGTFWIATHDMDFERPESRAIDYDTLEDLLAHVPARQKLLLIDTCQSGEGDGAAESAVAAPPKDSGVRVRALVSKAAAQKQPSPIVLEDFFANLSRGSGAQVLVAAAANELAIEKEGHGLFTQSVLEAIGQRKAATKSYGPISFSELAAYVVPRVIQASGGQQTPTVRRGRPEFDFAVD